MGEERSVNVGVVGVVREEEKDKIEHFIVSCCTS